MGLKRRMNWSKTKSNQLNPASLKMWNPPGPCFIYVSNFITLSDTYFSILSITQHLPGLFIWDQLFLGFRVISCCWFFFCFCFGFSNIWENILAFIMCISYAEQKTYVWSVLMRKSNIPGLKQVFLGFSFKSNDEAFLAIILLSFNILCFSIYISLHHKLLFITTVFSPLKHIRISIT